MIILTHTVTNATHTYSPGHPRELAGAIFAVLESGVLNLYVPQVGTTGVWVAAWLLAITKSARIKAMYTQGREANGRGHCPVDHR